MESYVIHFKESEQEAVLDLLSKINDVIINSVEPTSIAITIQLDDAEPLYYSILDRIEREIRSPDIITIRQS